MQQVLDVISVVNVECVLLQNVTWFRIIQPLYSVGRWRRPGVMLTGVVYRGQRINRCVMRNLQYMINPCSTGVYNLVYLDSCAEPIVVKL